MAENLRSNFKKYNVDSYEADRLNNYAGRILDFFEARRDKYVRYEDFQKLTSLNDDNLLRKLVDTYKFGE